MGLEVILVAKDGKDGWRSVSSAHDRLLVMLKSLNYAMEVRRCVLEIDVDLGALKLFFITLEIKYLPLWSI